MKPRTVFIVSVIPYVVFGLSFLLIPVFTYSRFGYDTLPIGAEFVMRYFGAALIGFASILTYVLKPSPNIVALRAVYLGHFIYCALAFFIAIANNIITEPKPTMLVMVVIFGFYSVWFGYLAFRK